MSAGDLLFPGKRRCVEQRMKLCRSAYAEGREAKAAGLPVFDNPYHFYSALADWWKRGWLDGDAGIDRGCASFRPLSCDHRARIAAAWAEAHGLAQPIWSPELETKMFEMRARGLTHGQIAIKLKKTRLAVKQRFRYLRLGRRN